MLVVAVALVLREHRLLTAYLVGRCEVAAHPVGGLTLRVGSRLSLAYLI